MPQPDVKETFSYLTRTIRDVFPNLAYIHFKFPTPACVGAQFDKVEDIEDWSQSLRQIWNEKEERAFFASSGVYDRESAEEVISRMGGAVVLRRYIPSPSAPSGEGLGGRDQVGLGGCAGRAASCRPAACAASRAQCSVALSASRASRRIAAKAILHDRRRGGRG